MSTLRILYGIVFIITVFFSFILYYSIEVSINNEYELFCLSLDDVFNLIIGTILSISSSILIINLFKPVIFINKLKVEEDKICIPVKNKSLNWSAINVKIEVALINNKFDTKHIELDQNEFLIIPKNGESEDSERVFKSKEKLKNCNVNCTELLINKYKFVRVRLYAQHEFTGFGKTFEQKFNLDEIIGIESKCLN